MAIRSPATARLGCGFILLTIVVSCALLVVNSLIVSNVLVSLAEILPAIVSQQRWSQAIGFVGPVLLLVVQWWAYDVAVDWLCPMRSAATGKGRGKG